VKSFLKTYGDCLGLDSRLLVDEYKRRYERPDHETHTIATLHRERERAARGPLVPPWLLTAAVLAAIVAALIAVGVLSNGSSNPGHPSSSLSSSHVHHHGTVTTHTVTIPKATTPQFATLQLVPTNTVYVCVVDAAGHMVIPGVIYSAGQTIPRARSSSLLVTVGNNSVTVLANGKRFALAPSANAIGFEVRPGGARLLHPGTGPNCG